MKMRKVLYWLLVIVLAATFLVSGFIVVRYVIDSVKQKNEYDQLAAQVERARAEALLQTEPETVPVDIGSEIPSTPEIPEEPTQPQILPEYVANYQKNPDLVGWLIIDGTPINYPVMHAPDRVDYYLKRNFEGKHSEHGCLYAHETCDVFAPSDNITIYGHHMKDGTMFASLENFRDKSFWEEYHTINFDTLYERHTYTIFAVFTTTASIGEGFSYHTFDDAADEVEFNDFVSTCKELAIYDTGITPRYGDKMICLSTCEYSQVNGRLVVAAVRDDAA